MDSRKRPFPLALWSHVCTHSDEYHRVYLIPISDEELTVTELQQKQSTIYSFIFSPGSGRALHLYVRYVLNEAPERA